MKKLFREIINNEGINFCTGCGACVQKCHKQALQLKTDEQGYYVAQFNPSACSNCNQCENVCPILYPKQIFNRDPEPQLYAVQMDDKLRAISSSGGMFSAVAEFILQQGGVVFGAAWSDDLSVNHVAIENITELDKLRRSKYVQSYIGDSYRMVKRYLRENRKVLFTGTPCQIAGLNAFLGKDDENLLTIDVLCLFAPSQGYFKKYLIEKFPDNPVVACNMRDKRHGWRCSVLSLSLSNGETIYQWEKNDLWEDSFLNRLTMSQHCSNCKFPCHQRQGDLTIGDFWEICDLDKSFDDLGTNSVLINSEKGKEVFLKIAKLAKMCKHRKLKELHGNRIERHNYAMPHLQAERFRELYPQIGFSAAAKECLTPHFDVCIMGCWEIRNYGSHLTYYALYNVLKANGYSIVFVGCPADAEYKGNGFPEYFKKVPYKRWEMWPQYQSREEMGDANKLSDTFIVGSDQLWYARLYEHFGRFAFLDFIHEGKRKIAYATSFGKDFFEGSPLDVKRYSYYMKRFDAVSVRETSGVRLCKETFGVDAIWNLDPVFLCDRKCYDDLIETSQIDTSGKYIAAYILDCTGKKAEFLTEFAQRNNLELRILTDPNIKSQLSSNYKTEVGFSVEDWLRWINGASFVITDSFHGMCVSLRYQKNFLAITNHNRGAARFRDYGEALGISSYILSSYGELSQWDVNTYQIAYDVINKRIEEEATRSKEWLFRAINISKDLTTVSEFDALNIRMDNEILAQRQETINRTFKKRFDRVCRASLPYRILRKIKHIIFD